MSCIKTAETHIARGFQGIFGNLVSIICFTLFEFLILEGIYSKSPASEARQKGFIFAGRRCELIGHREATVHMLVMCAAE